MSTQTWSLRSVVFLVLVAIAPQAASQVEFVGAWPFGPANELAYDAGRQLVFVGSGAVVLVADVSDPTSPQVLSDRIRTRGVIRGMAFDAQRKRLYVGAGREGGLEIWDLATPRSPRFLSRTGLLFAGVKVPVNRVALSGTNVYVAADFGFLHWIDASDPVNPVDRAVYDRAGNPTNDVLVAGGRLFASGNGGIAAHPVHPNGSLGAASTSLPFFATLARSVGELRVRRCLWRCAGL